MKRRTFSLIFFLLPILYTSAQPAPAPVLPGIWENASRFVEFSADGKMRIVLKPYYGFVYEDKGWIPCRVNETALAGVFSLALRYAGEKKDAPVPAAILGDSLFFRFFRKIDTDAAAQVTAAAMQAPTAAQESAPAAQVTAATPQAATATALQAPAVVQLSGFYQAAGNAPALRLYRSESETEFFCYYFSGNEYYRIRYWAADVRPRDVQARFTSKSGVLVGIPKFIPIDDVLYTCITSTGTVLRNYESGTYAVKDGSITFKADKVVFEGTAAALMKPSRVTVSPDGSVLAFGEPYLVRSKITALDAEIKAHNALRRPPRKPIFGFMKLDFYWDEIERIRNGK